MQIHALALLLVLAGAAPVRAAEPLFEYGGVRYAPADLSERMRTLYGSLLADQYRETRTLVDEMVFDVYVEQEAKRSGRDVREVGAELLEVPEPEESAVRAFYEQNRDRIPQPFEQIAERLREHMRRQAVLERREQVLARIKGEGDFRLLVEPPPVPTLAIDVRGRPFKGSADGDVVVVEFADYQCPNCKRAATLFDRLIEQHPGRVKVVYMDFPINTSGISRQIAYGGVCAQAQGRFWEYHDRAFAEQEKLERDSPRRLAGGVGLDLEKFDACMRDRSTRAKVTASADQARRLGVNATPTIFVDGKPFPSNHLIRDLGDYIAKKPRPAG